MHIDSPVLKLIRADHDEALQRAIEGDRSAEPYIVAFRRAYFYLTGQCLEKESNGKL